MRFCITGATGLLGGNLAVLARAAGHEVVATRRASSKTAHLDGHGIEWVEASLGDVAALTEAFAGCDGVFHCAAAVSIQYAQAPWIVAANVDGTRNVIEAVRAAGVRRLVHCSTVGAVGLSVDGTPCDETAVWNMPEFGLDDAYVTTKRRAQELVLEAVAEGLDAVIVNPTYMIGPYDARPSSGALIVDLVRGKVPGHLGGKNNFVDVRDVARGMLLAFTRGETGALYILGGENLLYSEFMALVCARAGVKPVTRKLPAWVGTLVGWGGDVQAKLTGAEPLINSAVVRWGRTQRFIFSSDRARRTLGYTTSPLPDAVDDALAWFREHDMI